MTVAGGGAQRNHRATTLGNGCAREGREKPPAYPRRTTLWFSPRSAGKRHHRTQTFQEEDLEFVMRGGVKFEEERRSSAGPLLPPLRGGVLFSGVVVRWFRCDPPPATFFGPSRANTRSFRR